VHHPLVMKLSITLELTSLDQVRGLEAALALYTEIEADRLKDHEPHTYRDREELARDKAALAGATQVLKFLSVGK
jgi:hypothetical protein